MDWWHEKRNDFPHLCLIASMMLPLPEHNGHQERSFSSCTWFDKSLSQRTLSGNHEMKVLLHLNRKLLEEHRKRKREHRDQRNVQAAKRAAEQILELAKKSRDDLAAMKQKDWDKMVAAQIEEGQNDDATAATSATTAADDDDSCQAQEQSEGEESDVSDHELRVVARLTAAEAEVADLEHESVFSS